MIPENILLLFNNSDIQAKPVRGGGGGANGIAPFPIEGPAADLLF